MEVRNSAFRTRVFAATLVLGLILGAQCLFSTPGGVKEKATLKTPSDDERKSPETEAGLRPATVSGISLVAANGQRVDVDAPTVSQLEKAWLQSTTRMKYLDHCQQTSKCPGFDDSMAFSYDLDVRRQQAQELRDFTRVATAYQRQNGGPLSEEAQKIARYFLATGNDDVKEAALALIDRAPLSTENVRAAFGAIEKSASGPLMKDLLKTQLAKTACKEDSYSNDCIGLIKHTMQLGGQKVQREFACHSLELITDKTAPVYAMYARRQDPRSTEKLCMKLNLEERARLEQGG